MVLPGWLQTLYQREVKDRASADVRSVAGTWLGVPGNRVYDEVIDFGQADFDQPVELQVGANRILLEPADRALLYAVYNQGRHLEELSYALARLLDSNDPPARTTLLDIGCGPATAGLAMAGALGNSIPFRYFGVDRSRAMRELGGRLMDAARDAGALHPSTRCWFGENPEQAPCGAIRGELCVVALSYLFASDSLDEAALAENLLAALTRIGKGEKAILYTNSADGRANQKFPAFRQRLEQAGFEVLTDKVTVFDKTTRQPKNIRYALFFRPADLSLC